MTPNQGGAAKYLFNEELEQTKRLCEGLAAQENSQNNKVISIIGNRGTGKTSLENAAKEALDAEYLVLDIIDPSLFNSRLQVLELVVGRLHQHVGKLCVNADEMVCDAMNCRVTELASTLRKLRVGEQRLNEESGDLEMLQEINERIDFRNRLGELVQHVLEMERRERRAQKTGGRCKALVVCIDDIDTIANREIYKMLEDIRLYLAENMIVLLGYREEQLQNAVLQHKLDENATLLEKDFVSVGELRDQSAKYIEKIAPFTQRVYLPMRENLLDKPLFDIVRHLMEDEGRFAEAFLDAFGMTERVLREDGCEAEQVTIRRWIEVAVYSRTRLCTVPVDTIENTYLNLPGNLRGLLFLVETLYNLEDLHQRGAEGDTALRGEFGGDYAFNGSACLRNLARYRTYLLSYAQELLDFRSHMLLQHWLQSEPGNKNHFMYQALYQRALKIQKDKNGTHDELGNLLLIGSVEPYNVAVGDVYEVLEAYKQVCERESSEIYLVYLIKLLYSSVLLESYLGVCVQQRHSGTPLGDNTYLKLMNGMLTPENFLYYVQVESLSMQREQTREYVDGKVDDDKAVLAKKAIVYVPKERQEEYTGISGNIQTYNSLVERIVFTSAPVYGPVYLAARKRLDSERNELQRSPSYRFNRALYYGEQAGAEKLASGTHGYDFYSVFAKWAYVQDSIQKFGGYVFYSMFDIDVFLRLNYHRRRGAKELFKNSMGKVNGLFSGRLNVASENGFAQRLAKPLCADDTGFGLDFQQFKGEYPIFSEKEMELVTSIGTMQDPVRRSDDGAFYFPNKIPKWRFVAMLGSLEDDMEAYLSEEPDRRKADTHKNRLERIRQRMQLHNTRVSQDERHHIEQLVNSSDKLALAAKRAWAQAAGEEV